MIRINLVHEPHNAVQHEMPRIRKLGLELVPSPEDTLELILRENKPVHAPRLLLSIIIRDKVVRARLEGGDDAEVVAGAAEGPPQVRVARGRGGDGAAVVQDNARGDEVVGGEAVLVLEHAVAAAQGGADGGDALAQAGY